MVYQKQLVVVLAPAKLNLSLDVAGLLPNGYHDLDMVMQTIDLYERPDPAPAGQLCSAQR